MTVHERILNRPAGLRVAVIGDLILDRYTWGNATRISPEAPIPVLLADQDEVRPGGAASVASLLRALDVEVQVLGVVGDDGEGATLRRILDEQGICTDGLLTVAGRPTTSKHRFIGRAGGRHPHQILRVDHEETGDLTGPQVDGLVQRFHHTAEQCGAVLISDYSKGVVTPRLVQQIAARCRRGGVPVLVDPGRGRDLRHYQGVTLLKPNRAEAEALTGRTIGSTEHAAQAAEHLRKGLGLAAAVITLDRDGIAYATRDTCEVVPTSAREAYDITGAGDMVLAALGYAAATGWPVPDAIRVANFAAGLEIERFGVEPITWHDIETAVLQPARRGGNSKVQSFKELVRAAEQLRRSGRRIVFTNGCFDLLHAGHIATLEYAADQGDALIVAINSDDSVQRLKGPDRPLVNQELRARQLAALSCVDHVVIFDEPTPHRLLWALRPDVLVKGGSTDAIVGHEVVEAYGGDVVRAPLVPGVSTTRLSESLRNRGRLVEEPSIQTHALEIAQP